MASTNSESHQGGRGGRACTRGSPGGGDPDRFDGLGGARLRRRTDRARVRSLRRERLRRFDPGLAVVHRLLRRGRADLPRRRRGRRSAAQARMAAVDHPRPRLVRCAVRRRRSARVLRAGLEPSPGGDRRDRAVVYAVLVETGLNRTVIGKRLMSATFVTDFGTVAMLSILFIKPTLWIVPFVAVSLLLIVGLPAIAPSFFSRYGDRVIEPEIKLVFASLFLLMWLGQRAHSHAVLPAFVLGLVMSSHYVRHRKEQERMRVVAFAFLTPFFFLKGGMNVSAGALWANLGVLALLFAGKIVPKLLGVYPLARRFTAPHAAFTTLLMSTGLTFGTISSLYGLNAGIIDRTQFSLLIAVVVLSAILPTAIAQRFFQPHAARELERDRVLAEVA